MTFGGRNFPTGKYPTYGLYTDISKGTKAASKKVTPKKTKTSKTVNIPSPKTYKANGFTYSQNKNGGWKVTNREGFSINVTDAQMQEIAKRNGLTIK